MPEKLIMVRESEWREMREALSHPAPQPSGWQPIETAPKDGRLILVATDGQKVGSPAWTGMYCAYWSEQEQLWLFHRSGYVPSPTHWMPLPAAPTAGGGDDKNHFIAAVNFEGRPRAFMRLDDMPTIHSVIQTLEEWEQTDPERRLVITDSVEQTFPALEGGDDG